MAGEQLQQGSIIWIEVPDPRGDMKKRPVVVLTPTDEIILDNPVVGAAVTTQVGEDPPEPYVLLPWDRRGHPATRLRRRCAAVCNWLVAFRPSDVRSVEGYVPQKTLLRVLKTVAAWSAPGETEDEGFGR